MAIESADTPVNRLPDATLPDIDGTSVSLPTFAAGRPLVVAFTCNHCPYVRSIEAELGAMANARRDVGWVAICSNDVQAYPDDDLPGLREQMKRAGWQFPYLVDSSQTVARKFGAVCTPDFFVFDSSGQLTYRGAMDDARPRQSQPVDGAHLRSALDAAARLEKFTGGKPSMGCGIKWKAG